MAYIRRGSLWLVAMPRRPSPSVESGRPAPNRAHVAPPSVERHRPLCPRSWSEEASPVSHGVCRAAHVTANTVSALAGSKARSIAPVFSSR